MCTKHFLFADRAQVRCTRGSTRGEPLDATNGHLLVLQRCRPQSLACSVLGVLWACLELASLILCDFLARCETRVLDIASEVGCLYSRGIQGCVHFYMSVSTGNFKHRCLEGIPHSVHY